MAGVLPHLIVAAGAVVTPYLTLAICWSVAAFYALPGRPPTSIGTAENDQ